MYGFSCHMEELMIYENDYLYTYEFQLTTFVWFTRDFFVYNSVPLWKFKPT